MYSKEYITNLLRHFNYDSALVLYREFGTSEFLMEMFSKSQTSFNEKKLKEWLKELLETFEDVRVAKTPQITNDDDIGLQKHLAKIATPTEIKPSNNVELPQYSLARYAKAPDEVQDLVKELKHSYRVKDSLFANLELLPTDEERLNAALEILDLADRIRDIWAMLLHYDTYKVLPIAPQKTENVKPILTDIQDLLKRKNTLKANISRDKKLRPHKVQQWKNELLDIENELNKG